jgi:DNA-directed RNA polymerase specialized sigma24 family protein
MAAMVTTGAVATSLERFEPRAGRPDREAARIRAAKLFDQHGALIQRICRHLLRDDFEAEDAAQQTFLSAYKALLGGAAPRDGEAWLATIARHECLQRIRVRMRLPLPVLDVELEDHRSNVHQLVRPLRPALTGAALAQPELARSARGAVERERRRLIELRVIAPVSTPAAPARIR